MFLQSSWLKWKETSTRDFFKFSKKNFLKGVFIILQLSANDFRARLKGGKQQHYNKPK